VRILLLANSGLGVEIAQSLREARESVLGLAVHPDETAKHKQAIITCHHNAEIIVVDPHWKQYGQPRWHTEALRLKADIGVSAGFGYRVPKELLAHLPIVNVHTGYLPYNRGACPNVWPIIDGSPAGVTLHWMDEGIDTGDIIAQERVDVHPWDTGETLHYRLLETAAELFRRTWPSIKEDTAPRTPQDPETGTHYRLSSLDVIDAIDLDREYKARDLVNLLRARTFPPYQGAYFNVPGFGRVYMRLDMEAVEDKRRPFESMGFRV